MAKPAQGHLNWVPDLNPNKAVNPGTPKGATGWVINEKPAFEYMNFMFATLDMWDAYFETTTDTLTANVSTLQTAVAAQGTAAGISATHSGHVQLTGTTVQAQLDQADASLKDLYDAVTSGKGIDLVGYDVASPSNWPTVPTTAGQALDLVASRLVLVEEAAGATDFADSTLNDYVIQGSKVQNGLPNGPGNPGLTDTLLTNPHQIQISELQVLHGEDRIIPHEMVMSGKYDANGMPEFVVVAPYPDRRVKLYGNWTQGYWANGSALRGVDGEAASDGRFMYTDQPGAYMEVTGVFDAFAFIAKLDTVGTVNAEIWIDGVDTGVALSFFNTSTVSDGKNRSMDMILSNPVLNNLTWGLHTVKLVNAPTTGNTIMKIYGFDLITTGTRELGGSAYVSKSLQNYMPAVIADPTVGAKGAKVLRYIDRADNTRKDLVANVRSFDTTASSIGSGATSFGVSSVGSLITANCLLMIFDSPTNAEIVRVASVNTSTNNVTLAAGTPVKNSYTNATVRFYGYILGATDHSNEQVQQIRHWRSYGFGGGAPNEYASSSTSAYLATPLGTNCRDGANAFRATEARSGQDAPDAVIFVDCEFGSNVGDQFQLDFKGTGIDFYTEQTQAVDSQFYVILDGVEVNPIFIIPTNQFVGTANANGRWYKIASDLPEGSHTILVQLNNGSTSNVAGFGYFKIYDTLETSQMKAVHPGNKLSMRTILPSYQRITAANYRTDPSGNYGFANFPNVGTIKQNMFQSMIFSSSMGWSQTPQNQGYPENGYYQTNFSPDTVERWFYGTGFELGAFAGSDRGIHLVTVDGQVLKASNFPSAIVQSRNYNNTTGLWDNYQPSATPETVIDLLSVSNLPLGLHHVTFQCTPNKNSASSNYYMMLTKFMVIGMPFESTLYSHSMANDDGIAQGAKDLRLLDSWNDQDRTEPAYMDVKQNFFGVMSPSYYECVGTMGAHIITSGGDIEVEFLWTAYFNQPNAPFNMNITIDGIVRDGNSATVVTANNAMQTTLKCVAPAAPGRHFVVPWLQNDRGASGMYTETMRMIVREVPKRARL